MEELKIIKVPGSGDIAEWGIWNVYIGKDHYGEIHSSKSQYPVLIPDKNQIALHTMRTILYVWDGETKKEGK